MPAATAGNAGGCRCAPGGLYRLQLETKLTGGELAVEIRESGTGLLLTLDEHLSAATLTAQKGKRYTATVQMMGASGSYALCWEREADEPDSF